MAYIRSSSNPENLYIFGTDRNIEIYTGIDTNPFAIVQKEVFINLVNQWIDGGYDMNGPDPIVATDSSLETKMKLLLYNFVGSEVLITHGFHPHSSGGFMILKSVNMNTNEEKIIRMYNVTWNHIVEKVKETHPKNFKQKVLNWISRKLR